MKVIQMFAKLKETANDRANLRFIIARPILSLSFIYRPLIFDIRELVGPSFIDQSLLPQYQSDN